jgi:hypothetical protein
MQMDHQERRAWVGQIAQLLPSGSEAHEPRNGNGFRLE